MFAGRNLQSENYENITFHSLDRLGLRVEDGAFSRDAKLGSFDGVRGV